jgi:hypothetical protein
MAPFKNVRLLQRPGVGLALHSAICSGVKTQRSWAKTSALWNSRKEPHSKKSRNFEQEEKEKNAKLLAVAGLEEYLKEISLKAVIGRNPYNYYHIVL